MDHYKALGVHRTATKDEIKEAFHKLALKYHPDKHSHSSKSLRDDATLRFKQASEAYEVLIDDRKRAQYNINTNNSYYGNSRAGSGSSNAYGYGYGYSSYNRDYSYRYGRSDFRYKEKVGMGLKFEAFLRFMTTRAFLLNVAFAGTLLGASYAIDSSGEALWKLQNSGKSFQDAMESIEKAKAHKEKT